MCSLEDLATVAALASYLDLATTTNVPTQRSQYDGLPTELKLLIARETLPHTKNEAIVEYERRPSKPAWSEYARRGKYQRRPPKPAWSKYACLGTAWRDTVEDALWETLSLEVPDLPDFQKFWVGRRRRILTTIIFPVDVTDCFTRETLDGSDDQSDQSDDQPISEYAHLHPQWLALLNVRGRVWNAFSCLFNALKASDHQDDEYDIGLEIRYNIHVLNEPCMWHVVDCSKRPVRHIPKLPTVKIVHSILPTDEDRPTYTCCSSPENLYLSPISTVTLASCLPRLTICELEEDLLRPRRALSLDRKYSLTQSTHQYMPGD